jgi:hypothetical protein
MVSKCSGCGQLFESLVREEDRRRRLCPQCALSSDERPEAEDEDSSDLEGDDRNEEWGLTAD